MIAGKLFVILSALVVCEVAAALPASPDDAVSVGVPARRLGRAGYAVINGKQYYVDDVTRRSYQQAVDFCVALSLRLIGLETEVEDLAIKEYVDANGMSDKQFWTSGARVGGTWTWVGSGVPFFYTNWAAEQPNSGLNDACVHTAVPSWGWADDDCTLSLFYMCE